MPKNLISQIIQHKTAANLFLLLMLILGIYASRVLNTQFFPNYSIDYITVTIEWEGASPKDIEESLIKPIEERVRYTDNIKNTKSTAIEGVAKVLLEFEAGTDMKKALNDVERDVKSITTLPERSKPPEIKRIISYEQIGLVLISGDINEYELKKLARKLRQELLENGIDKIEIDGIRQQVIYIDLDPLTLLSNNLDIENVSNQINREIKSFPSGILKDNNLLQLRTFGKRETVSDYKKIKIIIPNTKKSVNLSELGNIYESSKEEESIGLSKGKRAITLRVFRSLGNDTLNSTRILEKKVRDFSNKTSSKYEIKIYDLSSQLIRDRINLLLKNGLGGLFLVLIVLFLFLRMRVVIWVAIGIPAAISVTLAIMLATGQSVNMISLFALIMMLGIIVDDSIVVAEHIEYQYENGKSALEASYSGAIRMLGPVTAASLTTIAGFAPVFLISGVIGQVIEAIPLVVISVIIASFFECFFVLPGHLKGALLKDELKKTSNILDLNKKLNAFRDGYFYYILDKSLKYKFATFLFTIGLLFTSFSLVKFGHVKFYFFPAPESQIILANYNFLPGTLKKDTIAFSNYMLESLEEIDEFNVVKTSYATIGKPMWGSRISTSEKGDHIGGIIVELTSPEDREIRTQEIIKLWKNNLEPTPKLQNLTIIERKGGPPGLDVDIRLRSSEKSLKELKIASEFIKKELSSYKGISDIRDNLPLGKREIIFTLNEQAKLLGFNTMLVAKKIRATFDGISISKFFRGAEEIEVIVRNDLNKYDIRFLNSFLISSPNGNLIPLGEVVDIKSNQGFSVIKRQNGYREISITAEINENILNPDDFMRNFKEKTLSIINDKFDIEWRFAGRAEEQADTFSDMKRGAILSFFVI